MEHRTVRDILQLVSKDKLYADFTDIDNTRANPNGYGYYDIRHSSIGPFMVCYDNVSTNVGTMETIVEFRVPDIEYVSGTFGSVMNNGKQDPNHVAAVNFLRSLKVRPSAISLNEAIDKYHWIMVSPENRAKQRQHYVNGCVIVDLIDERLELSSRATKYSTIPDGGIRITTHFPFSGVETMNLYRTEIPNVKDSAGNTLRKIKVEIPAAGFVDTFDSIHDDYKGKMAFEHVDNYIKSLKSQTPMMPKYEEFGRFASDYRRTMSQIKRARQK